MNSRWGVTCGMVVLALTAVASGARAQSPSLSVSGVGYLQYAYQLHSDSSLSPSGHQNNFDVTRAYVNAIAKFSEGLTTRVTMDIDGRKAAANQLSFRLKYAYAAWTPENSHLTYKLGLLHTSLLDWEEALWDYRMQGTMPLERGGYVSSSDFGAGVDGVFGYEKLNFQVAVVNGENYSGTPGDQRKDIMGRVSYKLMNTDLPGKVGGLRLTGYAQYGKPTTGGQRQRYLGMLSYKSKALLLAAEYAATKDSVTGNGTITAAASRSGRVMSAYGVYAFPNTKLAVIGRVDITDPDTRSSATNDRTTRIIGGVAYQLHDHLRLLADIDNVSRQGGNYPNSFNATRSTAYLHGQITY